MCPNCYKYLSSKQMLQYHVSHKTCHNPKCVITTKIHLTIKPTKEQQLASEVQHQLSQIKELEAEVKILKNRDMKYSSIVCQSADTEQIGREYIYLLQERIY